MTDREKFLQCFVAVNDNDSKQLASYSITWLLMSGMKAVGIETTPEEVNNMLLNFLDQAENIEAPTEVIVEKVPGWK